MKRGGVRKVTGTFEAHVEIRFWSEEKWGYY